MGHQAGAAARVKPCAHPGCAALVAAGTRCPAHAQATNVQRGSQRQRGYTWAWERAAAAFKRQHPMCGDRAGSRPPVMSACHDAGRATVAVAVDHVTPHRGDPALFWDVANWQSLCRSCHSAKTRAGL